MAVRVMGGGAAKALVSALQARFTAETGAEIAGTFSAVGAIRDKALSGEACDVLILTAPLIEALTRQEFLEAGSAAPIGTVRTGIAVPTGLPVPSIGTAAALAAAIVAASAVYMPDPERSTAGIYFVDVLRKLGIERDVAPRLRAFPNGETAMHQLAEDRAAGSLGCTQMTEIKMTKGLTLVGPLPGEHDLATVYTAAVTAGASDPERARRLVAMLTGPDSRQQRLDCGFEA